MYSDPESISLFKIDIKSTRVMLIQSVLVFFFNFEPSQLNTFLHLEICNKYDKMSVNPIIYQVTIEASKTLT